MATSRPGTQPAAARRAAEAGLRDLVATHAPDHERLIGSVRRWLRKRVPTAHELVYEYADCVVLSYSPNEHGYQGVVALRASATEVRLYLNKGKGLRDPEKLLRGSGTQARWLALEGMATLARPAVVRLFDEALARNTVAFAPTGRGPVILKSERAKPRRRRPPG